VEEVIEMKRMLISVAPLLLLLGACGDSDDTSSTDTAASTGDVPQLTFTGSDCVYDGPDEVTAGVVTVELVNDSDGLANVNVGLLDEGKTVQDVIDDFGPEPATGNPPTWIADMGGQSPASAGETIRWESSLAAGQYVTWCARSGNAWFGAGFTVVDG
jgi:hypothetical protein